MRPLATAGLASKKKLASLAGWFGLRDAPVSKVLNIEEPKPGHFYWPDLDVDLTAEIIVHPERFPLESRS